MANTMKKLFGNTYEHKDEIKKLGGKWKPTLKCWEVPEISYDYLLTLCQVQKTQGGQDLGNAPSIKSRCFECYDCGDRVWSGTECWETGLIH